MIFSSRPPLKGRAALRPPAEGAGAPATRLCPRARGGPQRRRRQRRQQRRAAAAVVVAAAAAAAAVAVAVAAVVEAEGRCSWQRGTSRWRWPR